MAQHTKIWILPAEKLRALGVKPSKSLPSAMQENALDDDITTDTPLIATVQVAPS
jgi:hypothetical protein